MRDTSARTYLSSFYSENTPKNSYLSFIFSYLSSIFRVSLIIYYFLFSGNFLLYIDSVRTSSCNINTGFRKISPLFQLFSSCLLYTSDAADEARECLVGSEMCIRDSGNSVQSGKRVRREISGLMSAVAPV